MKKQNKRKGFSAIEMLVVIAVIALLVSVVVPVISNQSVKAKAAANAANLRTIESVVAMKLTEDPDAFEDYFKNGEASNKVDNFVEKGWPQKVVDYFLGEGAAESMIKDYYLQFSDGRTGKTLTIEGTSPQIIISGVALPVAMEAPRRDGGTGLVIGEYDYMSVYICQDGVLAFYNNFTKDDFADVAEDGYYDGAASAGGVENSGGILGGIEKLACQAQGKHEPGPGCKCRNCGAEAHVDAEGTEILGIVEYKSSTTLHECKCGKVFNAGHVYEGTDHKCKYKKTADEECDSVSPCIDEKGGGITGLLKDHKCDLCDGNNNHAWCNDTEYSWQDPDHKCNTCGDELSKCGDTGYSPVDALQHECNICKAKTGHTYNSGNTCVCDYSKPTCNYTKDGVRCTNTNIVESDGDKGYCQAHKLKGCTIDTTVWLPLVGYVECDGQYRGSADECSNKGSHRVCKQSGCGATSGLNSQQYCSEHDEEYTCTAKTGDGSATCNTKYRTSTCPEADGHHTVHKYENTGDAKQHHCLCGDAKDHTYDSNGECACGATKTKCQFSGGCNSFDVLADGHCATHQNLDRCTKKIKSGNQLAECTFSSRDPNATCTNQHYKYGTCGCNKSNRSTTFYTCKECDHRHTKKETCTQQVVVPE